MKTSIITTIIGLFMINVLSAQVKIGNNPQLLDPASILELESTNRVLVITRVTNAQMNSINPLRGALVFNTDEECIHYFNGTSWVNICEELDNSFTVSTRADFLGALNPNARDSTVVITSSTNLDDSVNYNFEVGQITGANIIDQSINGDSKLQTSSVTTRVLAPRSVTINKLADATSGNPGDMFQWNGTQWTLVNESTLGITEKDSIIGNEVVGPTDATLLLNGNGTDADPYTLDVPEGGITDFEILNGTILAEDIADAAVTNNKLDKTNIPLSGFGDPLTNVSMGNFQINNLQDPTIDTDAVNLQTLNAAIAASNQTIVSGDNPNSISIGLDGGALYDDTTLQNNITANTNNISANATAIGSNTTAIGNNTSAIALKEDLANKSTNVALGTSDVLYPSQNAVKSYVDNLVAANADDDITNVTFNTGTNLITVEEGATNFSADLSSLEESADITANTNNISANATAIGSNTTAI
ncbi:hypothetical protein, partial [Flagellimonas zhangzhouensis]|uniref:hypothetical protein n=2 Tax=Flagellimonas zhangzhouensis TaxID=1073328 RepID=UPI0011131741